MTPERPAISAVLFDLDGTLLDTAPDLMSAMNAGLASEGLPICETDEALSYISGGARAMLGYWLVKTLANAPVAPFPEPNPVQAEHHDLFERVLERMLDHYQMNTACQTRYYEGMETVLDTLDTRGIPWGIVTNKMSRFTNPLANAFRLEQRTPCIISGDTTAERKPHPLPLLEASRRLEKRPDECVYIGDAARDMEAGQRAGMATVAALYGYVSAEENTTAWGADAAIRRPLELLTWIEGD